jgi:transcriptional regulator NrdR family protein
MSRKPRNSGGMRCPKCGRATEVIESRGTERKSTIRRRRKCLNSRCRKRFTTYEVPQSLYFEIEWMANFRRELMRMFRILKVKP